MSLKEQIILHRDYIFNMIMRCKDVGFIDIYVKKIIDEIDLYKQNHLDDDKDWKKKWELAGIIEVLTNWRNSINDDTDEEATRDTLLKKLKKLKSNML